MSEGIVKMPVEGKNAVNLFTEVQRHIEASKPRKIISKNNLLLSIFYS